MEKKKFTGSENFPQKFKVLPVPSDNSESANLPAHSSFADEYIIFNYIKNGDRIRLKKELTDYFSRGMVMGRMSGNSLRQIQYWAVATISVAVHYAILGGLDETAAFNLSDEVIRKVDCCSESEEIFSIIKEDAFTLTELVQKAKNNPAKTAAVRKCLHYIQLNLKKRISVSELADLCSLSEGYLSNQFKSQMGMNITDYILKEKIELGKNLLLKGESYTEISYSLGFCSESHFISSFKKVCGFTPGKFLEMTKA